MYPVVGFGVIVNADHIHDGDGLAVVQPAVLGQGDGAGGIQLMRQGLKRLGDASALRARLGGFLIAHGPKNHAGTVLIAANQHTQLLLGCGAEAEGSVFRHDQQTQLVAHIHLMAAGRVMGGAVGVGPHGFQFLQAQALNPGRNGDACEAVILMAADPL